MSKTKTKKPYDYWTAIDKVPDDCGYDMRFKYDVNMNSYGINGDCISWCVNNCKHKWGWWFDNKENYNPWHHNYEDQDAYMSFQNKKEAMQFWLASGLANMGND